MKSMMYLIIILIIATPVYADNLGSQSFPSVNFEDNDVTGADVYVAETAFSDPGMLPDHPLYFIKIIVENIQIQMASDGKEKSRLHLNFAKTRLAETKKMFEENKAERARDSLRGFNREIDMLKDSLNTKDNTSLVKESSEFIEKSNIMLSMISDKIPENEKQDIENTLNNSVEIKTKIKNEGEMKEIEKEMERSQFIRKEVKKIIDKQELRKDKEKDKIENQAEKQQKDQKELEKQKEDQNKELENQAEKQQKDHNKSKKQQADQNKELEKQQKEAENQEKHQVKEVHKK